MRSIGLAYPINGRGLIRGTEFTHKLQNMTHADTVRKRALGRTLNHRTISHRIGKRNAQLNDVGTTRNERMHQRHGQFGRRIAGSDEGNEAFFLLFRQGGQRRLDAGHCAFYSIDVASVSAIANTLQ
jgi:hypothetical protein